MTVELKFINRWVRLSVSDTGCGIQEDQIPFLFDRYLHDDAMAPQPHGLGLGLPICQHIAERHGGTMIADVPAWGRGPASPCRCRTGDAGLRTCRT